MQINTKFNIGDTVYFLEDKVKTGVISSITVKVDTKQEITYKIKGEVYSFSSLEYDKVFLENKLFATKEELISSL